MADWMKWIAAVALAAWTAIRMRVRDRFYRLELGDASRERVKLAMRQYRARLKAEPRNRLIRAVYWHEVYHPTIPISQYCQFIILRAATPGRRKIDHLSAVPALNFLQAGGTMEGALETLPWTSV